MFGRVLMVCTGNVCRSPMAEALLSARSLRELRSLRVESAGIAALVGSPADPVAQLLMAERGLDLSAHRARQLTSQLVHAFELILVMEAAQRRTIEATWPLSRGRVQCLGGPGGFDVPDPYGRGRAAFARALSLIERGLGDLDQVLWRDRA